MQSTPLLIALSVFAGGLLPLQFAINAMLVKAASTTAIWAALVSVFVSTVTLAAVAAATLERWPAPQELTRIAPWLWAGGILGAGFVAISTFAIGRVGAAVFFAAVLFGQLAISVVLDHFGWLGLPVEPISLTRILGLVCLLAGLLLLRAG